MKLLSVESDDAFMDAAATMVMRRVAERPDLALTAPTGATPAALYRRLVREHRAGRFSLDAATVFMLDEYVDLLTYPVGSFREYLAKHLGDVIFNATTTLHTLAPTDDPTQCAHYDAALDGVGALDLAIVGVGGNGHVGFNEPGTAPELRTHVVPLAPSTIRANFAHLEAAKRPSSAVTVGLADLRGAREVLMLISGEPKRHVAQLLASERFDADVPATYLLEHPNLTVIVPSALLER